MNPLAPATDRRLTVVEKRTAAKLGPQSLPVGFEQEAFRAATRLSFTLCHGDRRRLRLPGDSPFCRCIALATSCCQGCSIAAAPGPCLTPELNRGPRCFAQLMRVSVPVTQRGAVVASLWTSPFLPDPPTAERFRRAIKPLEGRLSSAQQLAARGSFLQLPVVRREELPIVRGLLIAIASFLEWRLAAMAQHLAASFPPAVQRATDFIVGHLDERLSLKVIATQTHSSRFHLCRLFRKSTGVTLTAYINQHRVLHAAALLECPAESIAEIALTVGFVSTSHFDHVFRRYMGLSPRQYRAARRGVARPIVA